MIFKNVLVSPHYGSRSALLRWELTHPDYLSGNFVVQRSTDGQTNWITLHSDVGITNYIDEEYIPNNIHEVLHYRIILQHDGDKHISETVAPFQTLRPAEFGILRRMLQLEIMRMRSGNGLEMFLFKPLRSGELGSNIDPDTEQSLGNSLSEETYGQRYVGGFADPVHVWVEMLKAEPQALSTSPDGTGVVSSAKSVFRTVSYPEFYRGDLLVNPITDERYLVNQLERFRFRGNVPFVDHVDVTRLDRSDIRYKVPLNK